MEKTDLSFCIVERDMNVFILSVHYDMKDYEVYKAEELQQVDGGG